jgi:hypothetical protein
VIVLYGLFIIFFVEILEWEDDFCHLITIIIEMLFAVIGIETRVADYWKIQSMGLYGFIAFLSVAECKIFYIFLLLLDILLRDKDLCMYLMI